MIGISKTDRNMLRFLWLEEPSNPNSKLIHLRFTRFVFGLHSSPAILGAVLSHHLEMHKTEEPELVALIESSLYVDDLICGAEDEAQAFKCYSKSKNILAKAGMNLGKWNSNSTELMKRIPIAESSLQRISIESPSTSVISEEETYAKSTTNLQNCKEGESVSKLLGFLWNTQTDQFIFDFIELTEYTCSLPANRRSLLKVTAKIFDPLGFLSPFVI